MIGTMLDPIRAIVARIRRADRPRHRHPLDGMPIPDSLAGKPFDVYDAEGRYIASVNRPQHSRQARSMIG